MSKITSAVVTNPPTVPPAAVTARLSKLQFDLSALFTEFQAAKALPDYDEFVHVASSLVSDAWTDISSSLTQTVAITDPSLVPYSLPRLLTDEFSMDMDQGPAPSPSPTPEYMIRFVRYSTYPSPAVSPTTGQPSDRFGTMVSGALGAFWTATEYALQQGRISAVGPVRLSLAVGAYMLSFFLHALVYVVPIAPAPAQTPTPSA